MLRKTLIAAAAAAAAALALCSPALAQHEGHGMESMPDMAMPADDMPTIPMIGMRMDEGILGAYPATRDASGTAWQPDLAVHNGLHRMSGDWMFMLHADFTGIYDTQSGPRGDEKTFLAGMVQASARRDFAGGTLNLRAMLSPDPFMGKSGYPLLLAGGETADGVTHLVDRQHPHDLVMELSASYSQRLSQDDSVFFYAGYPGEPALGPGAYMHRASALDNPAAPISHHWLDSTHIAFGVATLGYVRGGWKFEVSQFTGREPDQRRFDFDRARFDSTSARVTYNPDAHWSLQASWAHIKSPEQLDPTVNENRFTASATHIVNLGTGSLATTLAFGNKDLSDGTNLSALLLESEYKPAELWTVFARAEWKQDEELGTARAEVGELSLGALRDFRIAEHVKLGLGASYTFALVPDSLTPSYGSSPGGTLVFTRLALD